MPALRPFKVDKDRLLEAIVYIIDRERNLSQYDILKTLFLADRAHLNKYGRPITFDNYVAMVHGPVPTLAYDLLKPDGQFSHYYKEEKPWVSVPEGNKINRFVKVKRPWREDVLSKTDREELNAALNVITSLSFGQIKRITHEDPAYIEAWARRGGLDASDMDMIKLLEDENEETIERLAYSTLHSNG